VLFLGANSIFAGDKLLTTPNPDVNDDMEMFEMLGLTPQNHLQKFQPTTVEAASSQFTLGENQNGQDQGHTLYENLEASAKENNISLHIKSHSVKQPEFYM
jgi:biotin synthase